MGVVLSMEKNSHLKQAKNVSLSLAVMIFNPEKRRTVQKAIQHRYVETEDERMIFSEWQQGTTKEEK